MSLIFSSSETDFVTNFATPIVLSEGDHELALVNLETYNSIPNIQTGLADSFTYSVNSGKTWATIVIPEGSYELDEIEKYIYKELKTRKHWDATNDVSFIFVRGNLSTLKCELTITDRRIKVDFSAPASVGSTIFGFEQRIYENGSHVGVNTVNILSVNAVLVHCDAVGNSYVDGSNKPTLYSFFPNVAPGYKIVEAPHNLIYLPITRRVLHSIRIWLTDQSDHPLNLRGETLTMRLHLRRAKKLI
jgi:hypothetical protein